MPVGERFSARVRRCQTLRASAIKIAADSQPGARQRLRALASDQAASDDRYVEGHRQSTC
jgi:hypothetical protein